MHTHPTKTMSQDDKVTAFTAFATTNVTDLENTLFTWQTVTAAPAIYGTSRLDDTHKAQVSAVSSEARLRLRLRLESCLETVNRSLQAPNV